MKRFLLAAFMLVSYYGISASELITPVDVVVPDDGIVISEEWQEYTTYEGVKIEYRMKRCSGEKMREQNLLLFRFTNTTESAVTFSWIAKEFRNGVCFNCENLTNPEYAHSITLEPGEILEGDGTSKENKAVYIFGNFIKFVPGMMEQTLTNFEFVNMEVR